MKRYFSILLVLMTAFVSVTPFFAVNAAIPADYDIEYFSDGSYGITVLNDASEVNTAKGTVTKTKSYNYYDNNNVLQWTVKLTATFSYNGTTASCTSASTGGTIYDTAWQITKAVASYSGNVATGEFTVKKYFLGIPIKTVNKTLTLTCSPSGVVT